MKRGDVVRLSPDIRPKYVSESLVELERETSPGQWEGTIVEIKYRAPRNASFRVDGKCRINASHVAA